MRFPVRWAIVLSCLCLGQMSCSRSHRPPVIDKVPLAHVKGTVLVDGVPTAGVHIQYIPLGPIAETRERYINKFFLQSGEGGKFSLSTYVNGDGIPYGDYSLEFKWMEQRLSGEIDRLGGFYADPGSPFMKIHVRKNQDLDLGEIRLMTVMTNLKEPE